MEPCSCLTENYTLYQVTIEPRGGRRSVVDKLKIRLKELGILNKTSFQNRILVFLNATVKSGHVEPLMNCCSMDQVGNWNDRWNQALKHNKLLALVEWRAEETGEQFKMNVAKRKVGLFWHCSTINEWRAIVTENITVQPHIHIWHLWLTGG